MKRLVGLAAVLVFFVATRGRAEEVVVARIECPAFVNAKINWNDKIGSDPTFHYVSGDETLPFAFGQMTQQGQTIQCIYDRRLFYRYTVKRKIISCKGVDPRILECVLVP